MEIYIEYKMIRPWYKMIFTRWKLHKTYSSNHTVNIALNRLRRCNNAIFRARRK